MSKVARIVAAVLVAVFIAGTASHATVATAMDVEMSMAGMDEGGMADCRDCPGDHVRAAVCDQFCVTVLVAIFAPEAIPFVPPADEAVSSPSALPVGITRPPDRHPPRTIRIG
ncbi:hypothetical protein KEU06_01470 [Pseudaminobacter sp. 19-2017]|uniref:DUF2946 domain-containing protein n=1 Tax=Pseudaminobacter soli (ex Zhang et al. 2022) TaxID=2831468 RepID=A0A942DVD3_9HYPH|nr:hypothetical protein [Pseudaminobacter soli]MBS3647293.1 hypothetical protein [Pseudaminobacter soli]